MRTTSVGDGPDPGEFAGFEQGDVLRLGAREGMMHRDPFVLLGREGQEREVDHPEEVQRLVALGEAEQLRAAQAHAAEHVADALPLVRAKKEHVARFEAQPFRECGFFGLGKEFHDRALPFAGRAGLDVGEALCAEFGLRPFLPFLSCSFENFSAAPWHSVPG